MYWEYGDAAAKRRWARRKMTLGDAVATGWLYAHGRIGVVVRGVSFVRHASS